MTSEAHAEAESRATRARAARAPADAPVVVDPAEVEETDSDALVVDCDRCTVRGVGCADCFVTVLLGGPPDGVTFDDAERHALDVLADAGLVPPLRMVEPLDVRDVPPG